MNIQQQTIFKKYGKLVKEIDLEAERLSKMHRNHLQCKNGCDLCCMDYNIFPVEFYAIYESLKSKNAAPKTTKKLDKNTCAFLKDHSCAIYEHRPVICRTHGLPLLYMNDDNEWELSNCELNFKTFEFSRFIFQNTFPQDKYNSKLFMLNKEFISGFHEEEYDETDLIPLKKLAEFNDL